MRDDHEPSDGEPEGVPTDGGSGDVADELSWADALAAGLQDADEGPAELHHRVPTRDQLIDGDFEAVAVAEPVDIDEEPNPLNIPQLNPFGLTEQEMKFAHAYAIWQSGVRAATFAGYAGGSSTASKLLNDSRIRGEVARAMNKALRFKSEAPGLAQQANEVIQLVQDVAFANPLDLVVRGDDGKYRFKRLEDIPDNVKNAIKSVRIKDGEVTVELLDRWQAIQLMAKFHQLGTRMIPGDPKTVPEQAAEDEAAAAARDITPPVPSMPLNHENVVRMNAGRLADSVLRGAKS